MNRVWITGHIGKTPRMQMSQKESQTQFCRFDVAVKRKESETDWIRVVAFGHLAAICAEHLTAGSMVSVSGKLSMRKTDTSASIIAADVEFIHIKEEDAGPDEEQEKPSFRIYDDDEIPV